MKDINFLREWDLKAYVAKLNELADLYSCRIAQARSEIEDLFFNAEYLGSLVKLNSGNEDFNVGHLDRKS